MTVYAPDGITIDQKWTNLARSGSISFVPSHGGGIYEIYATGAKSKLIAVGTFLVVPELPLGAIRATIASFGAFGLVKLRKKY